MRQRKSVSDARPHPVASRVIFTIASANYICHAATLMQSVREHHPEAARYIVLADAYREFPDLDLGAAILPCAELGIPLIGNMQLWYSITEFNTAIKPFVFRHLFAKLGHAEACYIDPDIRLFAPMHEVFEALGENSCVLTPHMMKPLQDGKEPSDLTIMKSGVYNLGFLGLRNDPDANSFLDWWADRCVAHCRIDIAANMFTDQRWVDLAPAFIEKHRILRHPGYNVAYWNLAHRSVATLADGRWEVNGRPLVFFHFSGIEIGNPKVFSRHQDRFAAEDLGPVGELCDDYRALVAKAGWSRYKDIRYAFGQFPDGRPIENAMRRWLLRAIDDERLNATDALRIDLRFFDVPDETAAARGMVMTRTMYQFWLDRSDLQTVFDIYTPDGLENYYNWFLEGNAEADGCDHRTVAAAEALRHGEAAPEPRPRQRRKPAWTSVAEAAWSGSAADALAFVRSDVDFTIENVKVLLPRQVALIWELRPDLQQHYPLLDLDSLHGFVAWVLSGGIKEGALDPELLGEAFIGHLARELRLSLYYRDVPLTDGMLMTRTVPLGRDFLDDWRRFPADRPARLAHGLWYAFVAPKLFRWPPALVEPVRRWFAQETEIAWAGFRLNRAELAIWELRVDLQQRFPLSDPRSCWSYLYWLVVHGLRELKLTLDEFDPRLARFLTAPSPRYPGVPQMLEMLHEVRPDLREGIDIATTAGRLDLHAWAEGNFGPAYAGTPAESLYPPRDEARPKLAAPAVVAIAHRAAIGLTGQWSAPSGRGEDLRNAAASLRAAGFSDFLVIDRDSGRVRRPDGSALPEGGRVELDANVVYLNAETAFHDWGFLQRTKIGAHRTIGFWAWELERLPAYWRHAFAFYDEILGVHRIRPRRLRRRGCPPRGAGPARGLAAGCRSSAEPCRTRPAARRDGIPVHVRFPFLRQPEESGGRHSGVPAGVPERRGKGASAAEDAIRRRRAGRVVAAERNAHRPAHRNPGRDHATRRRASSGAQRRCVRFTAPIGRLRPRPRRGDAAGQAGHPDRLFRHGGFRHAGLRVCGRLHAPAGGARRVSRRPRECRRHLGRARHRRGGRAYAAHPRTPEGGTQSGQARPDAHHRTVRADGRRPRHAERTRAYDRPARPSDSGNIGNGIAATRRGRDRSGGVERRRG